MPEKVSLLVTTRYYIPQKVKSYSLSYSLRRPLSSQSTEGMFQVKSYKIGRRQKVSEKGYAETARHMYRLQKAPNSGNYPCKTSWTSNQQCQLRNTFMVQLFPCGTSSNSDQQCSLHKAEIGETINVKYPGTPDLEGLTSPGGRLSSDTLHQIKTTLTFGCRKLLAVIQLKIEATRLSDCTGLIKSTWSHCPRPVSCC